MRQNVIHQCSCTSQSSFITKKFNVKLLSRKSVLKIETCLRKVAKMGSRRVLFEVWTGPSNRNRERKGAVYNWNAWLFQITRLGSEGHTKFQCFNGIANYTPHGSCNEQVIKYVYTQRILTILYQSRLVRSLRDSKKVVYLDFFDMHMKIGDYE